jgi:pimeloyl-ACP methyl ester carboxylesterase
VRGVRVGFIKATRDRRLHRNQRARPKHGREEHEEPPRDKFLSCREFYTGMAPHSAGHTPGETGAWSDPSAHKSSFVMTNGIRLHYLDWGGSGPALILIHGYGSNPHIFDDLALAFTDRFRVVAYARRGHGQSDAKEPYDTATLTEDLRGLMDGLGISRAHLAGWSMGGDEATAMARTHPERVYRIVYLDGAYDWGDPVWEAAAAAIPSGFWIPPASAVTSLDAYREYRRAVWRPGIKDVGPLEATLRESVIAQPDGTLRPRMSGSVVQAFASVHDRRDYSMVLAPTLAIYAATFLDTKNGNPAQNAANLAWEQKYMDPFRIASIERARKELAHIEIVNVPGTHLDFVFTCKEQVVAAMADFFGLQEADERPASA